MSETAEVTLPSSSAEPTKAGIEPSGDASWDAALAEVNQNQPAPEANAASAEENSAEKPAEEPVVAEPTLGYTFTTLQNGEHEVRLASGEVYRAKTERELVEKVASAKFEANKVIQQIRAQEKQAAPAPAAPQETQQPQIDPTSLAVADLLAPALGMKNGSELIAKFQQLDQRQNEFGATAEALQLRSLAAEFVQSTPDFVLTQGNAEKVEQALNDYGLPPTLKNMQLIHNSLKGQGLYETPPPRQDNGRFAPKNNMPLPPSGATQASTGKAAPSEADLWAMSPEKLGEYMDSLTA